MEVTLNIVAHVPPARKKCMFIVASLLYKYKVVALILTIYAKTKSRDANPKTTVKSTSSIKYLNQPRELFSFRKCF